jgi:hypothetical protein
MIMQIKRLLKKRTMELCDVVIGILLKFLLLLLYRECYIKSGLQFIIHDLHHRMMTTILRMVMFWGL